MKNFEEIFPLRDSPTDEELESLGWTHGPWTGVSFNSKHRQFVGAMMTGSKRIPKKGEWYLSGAIQEAYRSPQGIHSSEFFIVKLVAVDEKTVKQTRIMS